MVAVDDCALWLAACVLWLDDRDCGWRGRFMLSRGKLGDTGEVGFCGVGETVAGALVGRGGGTAGFAIKGREDRDMTLRKLGWCADCLLEGFGA